MKFGLVIFNIHMTQPLSKKNFDFSREFLRQNKARSLHPKKTKLLPFFDIYFKFYH